MSDVVQLGASQLTFGECCVIRGPILPAAALVSVKLLLPYVAHSYPEGATARRTRGRWNAGDCTSFPEPEAMALIRAGIANPFSEGAA